MPPANDPIREGLALGSLESVNFPDTDRAGAGMMPLTPPALSPTSITRGTQSRDNPAARSRGWIDVRLTRVPMARAPWYARPSAHADPRMALNAGMPTSWSAERRGKRNPVARGNGVSWSMHHAREVIDLPTALTRARSPPRCRQPENRPSATRAIARSVSAAAPVAASVSPAESASYGAGRDAVHPSTGRP
jgi:hypothetical protein